MFQVLCEVPLAAIATFDLKLRKLCRYYADITHKLRINYPYSCTTTQQLRILRKLRKLRKLRSLRK